MFLTELANTSLKTPHKTHVQCVCNLLEEVQAENIILKVELKEVKEINARQKERECRKHMILKNTPVASTEEVEKALREAEALTNRKKPTKKGKEKRTKKPVVPSDEEVDSSVDYSSDVEEPPTPVVFDCIEIAELN